MAVNDMFEKFISAFPSEDSLHRAFDISKISVFMHRDLGVCLPKEIEMFWEAFGFGYFGHRMLYFYGDGSESQARDSFQNWNTKDFWQSIYPSPRDGGPVFFAETCFGDQIGFRWDGSECVYVLFCIDSFEAFNIAKDGVDLFNNILINRFTLVDEERFNSVSARLGPLRTGMHYAPLVSPLIGGSGNSDNFCFETPNVHFRTAIATFQACRG